MEYAKNLTLHRLNLEALPDALSTELTEEDVPLHLLSEVYELKTATDFIPIAIIAFWKNPYHPLHCNMKILVLEPQDKTNTYTSALSVAKNLRSSLKYDLFSDNKELISSLQSLNFEKRRSCRLLRAPIPKIKYPVELNLQTFRTPLNISMQNRLVEYYKWTHLNVSPFNTHATKQELYKLLTKNLNPNHSFYFEDKDNYAIFIAEKDIEDIRTLNLFYLAGTLEPDFLNSFFSAVFQKLSGFFDSIDLEIDSTDPVAKFLESFFPANDKPTWDTWIWP